MNCVTQHHACASNELECGSTRRHRKVPRRNRRGRDDVGSVTLSQKLPKICDKKGVTLEKKIRVGDSVRYYDALPSQGSTYQVDYIVDELLPNGIPSCREPMLKLRGKPGYVLESHCFLMALSAE